MGRKVFLSFLGTGNYTECNYYDENNKSIKIEKVNFIQTALIKLYCKDFDDKDKIYIFLTEGDNGARVKNWDNNGNFKIGLKDRLRDLNLKAKTIEVSYNESEIWDMFNKMYEVLEDEDEVIFDVTHSFRYIPMLAMVMFNYAKFLKNIKLKAIHYGAFERLGHPRDVEKMDIKDRNAPIIDLIAFDELQQWSVGADNFVNYGNADKIVGLIRGGNTPVLGRKTKGKLINFADNLDKITKYFLSNRGKEIIKGKEFIEIKKSLKNMINNDNLSVFKPIFNKLLNDLEYFEEDDVLNGLRTVKWCIKHGLLQQGFTALEETITSWILDESLNNIDVFNYKKFRKPVGEAIHVINMRIKKVELDDISSTAEKILNSNIVTIDLVKLINKVKDRRNDLNHWGMKKDGFNYKNFENDLKEYLGDFEYIIS